jgi:hypothetical protein
VLLALIKAMQAHHFISFYLDFMHGNSLSFCNTQYFNHTNEIFLVMVF